MWGKDHIGLIRSDLGHHLLDERENEGRLRFITSAPSLHHAFACRNATHLKDLRLRKEN